MEGTFCNDLSSPPSISFPSIVSVIPDVEKKMLISVQGPVDQISIEPQFPFYFDKSTVTIMQKAALVTLLTENTYLRTGDIAFLYVDFVVEGENTVLKDSLAARFAS